MRGPGHGLEAGVPAGVDDEVDQRRIVLAGRQVERQLGEPGEIDAGRIGQWMARGQHHRQLVLPDRDLPHALGCLHLPAQEGRVQLPVGDPPQPVAPWQRNQLDPGAGRLSLQRLQ
ncbi:hypothetical protein GCM10010430_02190 [Kitasatospora cystarginea]|uniref:Uncharacterized protein n=1 Tax=Kitasatospora cystarginea TaxID=58350 RepID=A0ABN3DBU7_9ACTN